MDVLQRLLDHGTALACKVDSSTFIEANTQRITVDTRLETGLAEKADAAATTAALLTKADGAATTAALLTKADGAATTTALAGKVDTTAFSEANTQRVQQMPGWRPSSWTGWP